MSVIFFIQVKVLPSPPCYPRNWPALEGGCCQLGQKSTKVSLKHDYFVELLK